MMGYKWQLYICLKNFKFFSAYSDLTKWSVSSSICWEVFPECSLPVGILWVSRCYDFAGRQTLGPKNSDTFTLKLSIVSYAFRTEQIMAITMAFFSH